VRAAFEVAATLTDEQEVQRSWKKQEKTAFFVGMLAPLLVVSF
jgi:hypothetical protein